MEDFNNQFDIDFVKTRANFIRHSYIEEMEKHLLAFENILISHNINVKWIVDEEELVSVIKSSMPKHHYNKVCFDFPYIPQSLKSEDKFFKFVSIDDLENNTDSVEHLFIDADFGIVETGTVVLFNKKSKNCFNKVGDIYILLDINKLVVKQDHFDTLIYLRSLSVYNHFNIADIHFITAPMKRIIADSFQSTVSSNFTSEEVNITVLLYDNGITNILRDKNLRESLYCIECGLCKTVCPVYAINQKQSPIELLKNNCFEDQLNSQDIFKSTTLCGNCNFICPVLIPFTNLFINQMEMIDNNSFKVKNDDLHKIFMKRSKLNKFNGKIRRYFFIRKYYGNNKKLSSYLSLNKDDFFNVLKSTPSQNK